MPPLRSPRPFDHSTCLLIGHGEGEQVDAEHQLAHRVLHGHLTEGKAPNGGFPKSRKWVSVLPLLVFVAILRCLCWVSVDLLVFVLVFVDLLDHFCSIVVWMVGMVVSDVFCSIFLLVSCRVIGILGSTGQP